MVLMIFQKNIYEKIIMTFMQHLTISGRPLCEMKSMLQKGIRGHRIDWVKYAIIDLTRTHGKSGPYIQPHHMANIVLEDACHQNATELRTLRDLLLHRNYRKTVEILCDPDHVTCRCGAGDIVIGCDLILDVACLALPSPSSSSPLTDCFRDKPLLSSTLDFLRRAWKTRDEKNLNIGLAGLCFFLSSSVELSEKGKERYASLWKMRGRTTATPGFSLCLFGLIEMAEWAAAADGDDDDDLLDVIMECVEWCLTFRGLCERLLWALVIHTRLRGASHFRVSSSVHRLLWKWDEEEDADMIVPPDVLDVHTYRGKTGKAFGHEFLASSRNHGLTDLAVKHPDWYSPVSPQATRSQFFQRMICYRDPYPSRSKALVMAYQRRGWGKTTDLIARAGSRIKEAATAAAPAPEEEEGGGGGFWPPATVFLKKKKMAGKTNVRLLENVVIKGPYSSIETVQKIIGRSQVIRRGFGLTSVCLSLRHHVNHGEHFILMKHVPNATPLHRVSLPELRRILSDDVFLLWMVLFALNVGDVNLTNALSDGKGKTVVLDFDETRRRGGHVAGEAAATLSGGGDTASSFLVNVCFCQRPARDRLAVMSDLLKKRADPLRRRWQALGPPSALMKRVDVPLDDIFCQRYEQILAALKKMVEEEKK